MYQALGTIESPRGLSDTLSRMAAATNPRDNAGSVEVNVTRKTAASFCFDQSRPDNDSLAQWVRDNCGPVEDEVSQLARAKGQDPINYARRVTIMALLSAQVNFAENLYCTRRIIQLYAAICDMADDPDRCLAFVESLLSAPYKGHGKTRKINGYRTKARNIVKALPFLCTLTPEQMTLENLNRLSGVGPKVAAFTVALWDASAPVFTLDVWMLRLTASLLGMDVRFKASLTPEGYALVEGSWLAWQRRHLPDLPPFVVQWSIWNGVFGYHRSHLDIIR